MQKYFQRLEQTLKEKNISKGALAQHLHVALSTVSRWRNGAPRMETVQKTADFLGVSAQWLMTGETELERQRQTQSAAAVFVSNGNPKEYLAGVEKKSDLWRDQIKEYDPADGGKVAELERRVATLERALVAMIDMSRASDELAKFRTELRK